MRVNFLLVFVFIVACLFFTVNTQAKLLIDLNNFFVQSVVQKGNIAAGSIQFINLGDAQTFHFSKNGDFFELSSESILVERGQSATINLLFDEDSPEGVYIGSVVLSDDDGDSIVIPVVLGVESKPVLFDVAFIVSQQASSLSPGDRLVTNVQLYNLGSLDKSVDISYYISDLNGKIILTDYQTVEVKNKLELTRDMSLPKNIAPGDYVFYATAKKGDSLGLSSFLFTVTNKKKIGDVSFFIVASVAVLLIVCLLFFNWIWKRRLINNSQYWDRKVSELKKMKSVGTGRSSARKLHKLEYELQLLETAHERGYLKKESYLETKTKLLKMIRDSKKRL